MGTRMKKKLDVKSIPLSGIDTHNLERNEMDRNNSLKALSFCDDITNPEIFSFISIFLSYISSYRSLFLYYNKSQFEKSRIEEKVFNLLNSLFNSILDHISFSLSNSFIILHFEESRINKNAPSIPIPIEAYRIGFFLNPVISYSVLNFIKTMHIVSLIYIFNSFALDIAKNNAFLVSNTLYIKNQTKPN